MLDLLRSRLGGVETDGGLDSLAREVASGERDPYGAADLLLKELGATSGL